MKQLTGMSAVITLALVLSACGSSKAPVQAPATMDISGDGVTASATVGGTTTATLQFKNGGGTDLEYSASASYPGGGASGWLNFAGADASGTVKAGESKTVTVNVTCQPFAGSYAATVTLLGKDGKLSKDVPVTLNCTAEANVPDNAPVLKVQAAETTVSSDAVRVTGSAFDNVQVQRVTYRLGGGAETNVAGLTGAKSVALDFSVPGLSAGNNEIVVTAYDTSNNATRRTLAVTYNAPVTPPADRTAPLLTVPGDQLTNQESLSLSVGATDEGGSGLKGVTYTVSKDGGTRGEPTRAAVSGSGYSVNLAGLIDGVYTVSLTAEDNAGNPSLPGTVRVTVDRTAPALGVSALLITDNHDGTAGVRVSAPDAAGVLYSTDGVTYVRATGTSFTLPRTGMYSAGTYPVWVMVVDAAGNVSTPVQGSIVIAPYGDLMAPELTVPEDALTRLNAFSVTGTVSDSGSGVKGVTYTVSKDGVSSAPMSAALDGGAYSLELPNLTDGVYTVSVTAQDNAGNRSVARTVRVTVDQTAPSLGTGDVSFNDLHDGTVGLSVSVSDAAELWYSTDGITFTRAGGASPFTFTLPSAGSYAAGSHSVWLKAVDAAGNPGQPAQYAFAVAPYGDLTAPLLSVQGSQLTRESRLGVTGTVSDEGGSGLRSVRYTLSKDGGVPSEAADAVVSGTDFSLDLTGLTDGVYTVAVTAQDNAGNEQSVRTTVTVDQTAPTLGAGEVKVGDNHDGTATVTVTGSGADTVWYSLDGTNYFLVAGGSFTLPVRGAYAAGTYPLWVRVMDAAGNTSTPVQQSFTIAPYGDLTAPGLVLDAVGPSRTGHVSVTGRVTDESPVSATYTLSGPSERGGDLVPGQDGRFMLNLEGLEEGRYALTVNAWDAAGNRTQDQVGFLVDRSGPVSSGDVEDTTWRNTDFAAHFTASDELSGLTNEADASFDLTVTGEALSSTQPAHITHTVRDRAGNETTVTASALIDRTAPTVTAKPDRLPVWNGWYGDDVTVSFTCADALSGVAECPAPQVLSASGPAGVTVQDRAGNSATASLDLKIDKSGPVFGADLTGTRVSSVDGGYDARVTGTLTDQTSIESVTVSVNGSTPTPVSITPGASVALDLTVLALQDGPNSIVLTATDVFGRTSQQTVTVVAPDLGAPTLMNVAYELVNPGTTTTTLRLYGEATDFVGVTRVTYSLNGSAETDLPLSGPATGVTFDRTVGGLVSGTNTLTVRAYDAAGNVETQTQTFNISATDYIAPSISNLMAVFKGNSRNVGVTATISDQAPIGATAGIRDVRLQYTLDGRSVDTSIRNSLSGTALSHKLTNVPVGTVITIVVTDLSGNVNSAVTKVVRR